MSFKDIKAIIDNSEIVRVKKGLFVCSYGWWILKIDTDEEKTEYQLFYKGVHITTEFRYGEDEEFDGKIYPTISEQIDS